MDKLHKKYAEILKKQGKEIDKTPKILELKRDEDRKLIMSHIKENFNHVGSIDKNHIDEYLNIKKTTKGYDCSVLVGYRSGENNKTFYFEVHSTDEDEAKKLLGDLKKGEKLHFHVKGDDYAQLARELSKNLQGKVKYICENGYYTKKAIINNKLGLHARTAALVAEEANKFADTEVYISHSNFNGNYIAKELENNKPYVDATSVMSMLTLQAKQGSELEFKAKGPHSKEVVDTLEKIVKNGFDED